MSRRVLITGGAGFIGTRLARALRSLGDEVILLDALTEQVHAGRPWQCPAGVTLLRGDVRDRELLRVALRGGGLCRTPGG